MTSFDKFFEEIINIEGEYSNHPDDSGGETRYGIIKTVAREYGYFGPMKDLPLHFAKDVYFMKFWKSLALDEIASRSELIALKLGDISVNMGTYRAGEFFQRLLNVLNGQEKDYKDIKVDGNIGPLTIDAFNSFLKKRKAAGEKVLVRGLNCLQGSFYITLAERRAKDESFVFGWLLNRVQ